MRENVNTEEQQTFADHLSELRRRVLYVALNLSIGMFVGFLLHKQIEAIIQRPLGQTLYYSSPSGGLAFVMQIAFGFGLIVSLPLIIYQTMQFIRPSLKPVKTRLIVGMVACSMVLSAVAAVYVYFLSLPAALTFLTSFNSSSVQALISVSDYMKFISAYVIGAMIAFQLPLFLYFANKIRRFPPGGISGKQRHVILGAVIAAGVITPTIDPINQFLLAAPIILLFEAGALIVWRGNKRAVKLERAVVQPESLTAQIRLEPTPVLGTEITQLTTPKSATAHVQKASTTRRTHRLVQDMVVSHVSSRPTVSARVVEPTPPTITRPTKVPNPGRQPFMDIMKPSLPNTA